MKKISLWSFSIVIAIMLILSLIHIQQDNKEIYKHRRQSWLKMIDFDEYNRDYTGKGIVIAVIDSSVDTSISELSDSVIKKTSVLEKESYENIKHGTAVASIIAGKSHSDKEASGIATGSKIISIDILNNEDGIAEVEYLARGIEEAISEKVDIINLSIGCLNDSERLKQAVQMAIDNNILVIASAGNYMENRVLYPSGYNNVLSVGAINQHREIISPIGEFDKKVIYFPGENIVAPIGNGKYAGCDGTSFSTAICSGIAALLLEKRNDKKAVYEYLCSLELRESYCLNDIMNQYN